VRSTMELSVEDNADSDSRAEGDKRKALQVLRCPSPAFTESRGVGVVLDGHRNPKLGLEEIAQRHLRPASQISGGQDDTCRGVDQPGNSNANPAQVRPLLPAAGKQRIDGPDQTVNHRLWSDLSGRREHVLGQDITGRAIPRQQGGLGGTDVDAKHDVASRPDRLGACQFSSPTVWLILRAVADRIVTEAAWSLLLGQDDCRRGLATPVHQRENGMRSDTKDAAFVLVFLSTVALCRSTLLAVAPAHNMGVCERSGRRNRCADPSPGQAAV
jgi:hypothetical protein